MHKESSMPNKLFWGSIFNNEANWILYSFKWRKHSDGLNSSKIWSNKVLESLGEHEVKPWSEIQAVHLSAPVWRNQISCFCFFMYHSQATDSLRLFYVVEGHAIFLSFHLRFAVCYFFTMLSKDNSGNFWLNEKHYFVFSLSHTSYFLISQAVPRQWFITRRLYWAVWY